MTIQATITGRASEPRSRTTNSGKPVMSFGIAATPAKRDKLTNEWADDGEPLWVEISLWERDAERWAGIIEKGTQVAVSATLALEAYETRNGERREKLVARFPRILGIIPPAGNTPQGSQNTGYGTNTTPAGQGYGGYANNAYNGNTGGTQGSFLDDTPPF